jgi:hypothetical protein
MVCATNQLYEILANPNHIIRQTPENFPFYPFLHTPFTDIWNYNSKILPQILLSQDSSHILQWMSQDSSDRNGSFTMIYGDFNKIYSSNHYNHAFDAVVTCFFIDTAANILQLIAIMKHILKENGIWLNIGPLHYHRASMLMYSYDQLELLIQSFGFQILSKESVAGNYSGENIFSMKPEYYHVPLTTFRSLPPNMTSDSKADQEGERSDNDQVGTVNAEWRRTDYTLKY